MVTLLAQDGPVVDTIEDTAIAAATISLFITFSIDFRGINAPVTEWFHPLPRFFAGLFFGRAPRLQLMYRGR
jgi:hypothetical protein